VREAAEVREHVIEHDAAALELPRRHRRVEAARDQRDGPAPRAERQAAGARRHLREDVRRAAVQLDARGEFGAVEIHARREPAQALAQRHLDVAAAEGQGRIADPARAHREALPAHRLAEGRLADTHHVVEARDRMPFGPRRRLHAEHARQQRRRARVVRRDQHAVVPPLDRARDAFARQRVLHVAHELHHEGTPRGPGLGGDLARQAQQHDGVGGGHARAG
jgi:hypothetical protein